MQDILMFITKNLPYDKPFLFVERILEATESRIKGQYTFSKEEYFYKGHFKDCPVTPGVILTECMAQIGVVSLGLYLFRDDLDKFEGVYMTSNDMQFYKPVYPEETVTVVSEKVYYRFHKLKCEVKMYNEQQVLVAKGSISGMVKPKLIDE